MSDTLTETTSLLGESSSLLKVVVRRFKALQAYADMHDAMVEFTASRDPQTPDEIWVLQHYPIFTQGQAGKAEHVLAPGDIPVFQSDRGGQVTYHGPGQWVLYFLLDLRRLKMGVRSLVDWVEQGVVTAMAGFGVTAYAKPEAPGVYLLTPDSVEAKIASLGLRVRNGKTFHGIALNVNMDLEPFSRINPCGYAGMKMTQLSDIVSEPLSMDEVADPLLEALLESMPYALREQVIQNG
jgi:lipoyl(octanoyl) transferase